MAPPSWLAEVLGVDSLPEGGSVPINGAVYLLKDGILRESDVASESQSQTSDTFGFKWHQRETFESQASLRRMREWLLERYGDIPSAAWWDEYPSPPLVLDAGCGAAMSALELFDGMLNRVRYLGVDISEAVDVAAARFAQRDLTAGFMQADITKLPLRPGSVDVIFSEGVLHHTDSTRDALLALSSLLRNGGRFLFYVYRRKGPIREFTDDYIREKLHEMAPTDAWQALMPITRLGDALGRLNVRVDIPEDIELLGISAGPIDIQRFFYWHVLKAYYRSDATLEEMHHINYDWYAPANAHRQSAKEIRDWCEQAELEIEREQVQESGITIVARKRGG